MTKFLNGKVFISTRPKGKTRDLEEMIQQEGGILYELPMIELIENNNQAEIESIIANLKNYTHIFFTSSNAFHFFNAQIKRIPDYQNLLSQTKIASIGYKTTELIKSQGYHIEFDAQAKTGNEFIQKVKSHLADKKVNALWPTGDLSPNNLLEDLTPQFNVKRLDIYKNKIPKSFDSKVVSLITHDNYDMIVAASPSAVKNLHSLVQTKELKLVCIGQTTANMAINSGISPLAVASEPNALGIFNAILQYYSNNLFTK